VLVGGMQNNQFIIYLVICMVACVAGFVYYSIIEKFNVLEERIATLETQVEGLNQK